MPVAPARDLDPPIALPALVDIATGLAAAIEPPGSHATSAAPQRLSERILVTPAYEAWLLSWPPGTAIEPHDHGDSNGAFVVIRGELTELQWAGGQRRARTLLEGEVSLVPVGAVHGVASGGSTTAHSVHVYSPPLTEMRFFGDDGREVLGIELVDPAATPEGVVHG